MTEPPLLIVDDDPGTCETLSDIFQEKGYTVATATTGREAQDKAKQMAFNVALIDIKLPDVDGTALLTEFRKTHPDMVCMIITGNASVQNAIKALEDGAEGYFVKPLIIEEIVHRVEETVDKQRLVREKRRLDEELAKERDYTRHLIESSPDFQMTLDKDGRIMDVNEAFKHVVGKSREELIGSSIYEYLPKEETEKAIAEIFEQVKVRNIELPFNIPGKEALICNFSGTVFTTPEGKTGSYVTGRDITEQRRAEEAVQKAHDELELRVKERTAELERSNEQLRTEISDRKQAEQKVKNLELSVLHRLFKQGKCYLLVEEKPDTCFKLFNKLIEYGFKGMLISRIPPSQIQEEYNVKDIPTIWLTQVREENCIEPTNITQLSIAVKGFAEKGAKGVILLEGLEYLIVQNGFEVVLRFVQTMADIVMISKCRLIISFDAQTLGEVELHRLERELNVMNANEVKVLILD